MKKIPEKFIGNSWDNSNSQIKSLYIISWVLFVIEVLLFLFFTIREGFLIDNLDYIFYQFKHSELDLLTVLEILPHSAPIIYVIVNIIILKKEKLGIFSLIILFILRVTSPVTIMGFLSFIFTYIITDFG